MLTPDVHSQVLLCSFWIISRSQTVFTALLAQFRLWKDLCIKDNTANLKLLLHLSLVLNSSFLLEIYLVSEANYLLLSGDSAPLCASPFNSFTYTVSWPLNITWLLVYICHNLSLIAEWPQCLIPILRSSFPQP